MERRTSQLFHPNSTPRWLIDRFVAIPILGIVSGFALVIFAAPAWFGIQLLAPDATPFLAGAILAFLIQMVGSGFVDNEEEMNIAFNVANKLHEQPRRVQLVVITTFAMIPAMGISLHVLAIALIANTIVTYTALAVALPFILSPIDAWLGRRTGISFGSIGIYIGVVIIRLIAVLRGVPQEFATEAGRTAQSLLFGTRKPQ